MFWYYNTPPIGPFWTNYWTYLFKFKVRYIILIYMLSLGFPSGSDGKESACSAGDPGSIPGSRRSPGEGNGNPLQYSCLKNPMDGGVWQATVHEVAKSQTQLSDFICFLLVKKQSPASKTVWKWCLCYINQILIFSLAVSGIISVKFAFFLILLLSFKSEDSWELKHVIVLCILIHT